MTRFGMTHQLGQYRSFQRQSKDRKEEHGHVWEQRGHFRAAGCEPVKHWTWCMPTTVWVYGSGVWDLTSYDQSWQV